MHEVKFRGQRVDNKGWVYGYLFIPQQTRSAYIITETADGMKFTGEPTWFEVIPETVGQYTEFKDRNKRDIYEKDDARCFTPYGDVYYSFIELNDGCWEVAATGKQKREYLKVLVANHAIEVVTPGGSR